MEETSRRSERGRNQIVDPNDESHSYISSYDIPHFIFIAKRIGKKEAARRKITKRWAISAEERDFVVVVIFAFVVKVRGDYGEDETSHKCGGGKYDLTMPYATCVNQLVNDVARLTHAHGYNYIASSNYMGTNCYGYGPCDRALSSSECNKCILDASNNIFDKSECKFGVTGQIRLDKCGMGYQDSPATQT